MLMRTTKETIPWQMFTLREGSEVLVRKATPKDTEGLFEYRRSYPQGSDQDRERSGARVRRA